MLGAPLVTSPREDNFVNLPDLSKNINVNGYNRLTKLNVIVLSCQNDGGT